MTITQSNVGRELLVALTSNDESEFVRILDAFCLQIRGNRLDIDREIARVLDQLREGELALGLAYDLASWKVVKSEMMDRLSRNEEELLAA